MLILPALFAFIISFSVTPIVIRFANYFKLVDDPKKRHHPARTHEGVIPRAGGIAILLGFIIPVLFLLPINKVIAGILLAACITVLIGILDDRKDLSPYLRFIANIATAALVVATGLGIPFITNPFDTIIKLDTLRISFDLFGTHSVLVWSDLIAILWIVWTMNIVGWSSGVDGQMPGFVAITTIVLGISSLRFSAHDISQKVVASLSFITAGTFLGFLPWNFYPQKIMPGYGGKTLAGLLIAVLAILSGNKVGTALLVLSIPMIDAIYALFRRVITKKSPFKADRFHFHHHLLNLGWGKRRIALFYWLISFILGVIALNFNTQQKLYVFLIMAVIIGGILAWFSSVFYSTSFKEK